MNGQRYIKLSLNDAKYISENTENKLLTLSNQWFKSYQISNKRLLVLLNFLTMKHNHSFLSFREEKYIHF
jgi:hypothetical protein